MVFHASPSPGSLAVASERCEHLKEGEERRKEGERERGKMEEGEKRGEKIGAVRRWVI